MLRRFPRSIYPPSRSVVWHSRNNIYGKCFLGVAIGVFGTTYLSQGTIYGDTPGEEDSNRNKSKHSNVFAVVYPTYNQISKGHDDLVPMGMSVLEASCTITGYTGIKRIDAASAPNFIPRRDIVGISSVNVVGCNTSWILVGLFDGLGGPETKDYIPFPLMARLVDVLGRLCSKYRPLTTEHVEVGMTSPEETNLEPHSEAIDRAIKKVFVSLDKDIVHAIPEQAMSSSSWVEAIKPLGVASSGASVLLSLYDSDSRTLKLALTGNSRAILGRLSEKKDVYEVHVLTAEHNLQNPEEHARLSALYPNEHFPVDTQWLTRAFGLAAFKWSHELQERIHRDHLGGAPFQNPLAPPSVTAEPVITTVEIMPGDFLIMGSSGLWNSLTNEEAVGLVGLGLNTDAFSLRPHRQRSMPAKEVVGHRELPVHLGPDHTAMHRFWRTDKNFICNKANAASNLATNALGGADQDLTNALLAVLPPRSWIYRHDINVAVIFFTD